LRWHRLSWNSNRSDMLSTRKTESVRRPRNPAHGAASRDFCPDKPFIANGPGRKAVSSRLRGACLTLCATDARGVVWGTLMSDIETVDAPGLLAGVDEPAHMERISVRPGDMLGKALDAFSRAWGCSRHQALRELAAMAAAGLPVEFRDVVAVHAARLGGRDVFARLCMHIGLQLEKRADTPSERYALLLDERRRLEGGTNG